MLALSTRSTPTARFSHALISRWLRPSRRCRSATSRLRSSRRSGAALERGRRRRLGRGRPWSCRAVTADAALSAPGRTASSAARTRRSEGRTQPAARARSRGARAAPPVLLELARSRSAWRSSCLDLARVRAEHWLGRQVQPARLGRDGRGACARSVRRSGGRSAASSPPSRTPRRAGGGCRRPRRPCSPRRSTDRASL